MSTGNDIVYLPATRAHRTCRPRFYSRIISPAEQRSYHSPDLAFDEYVWLCWSVKESAYKYFRRRQPGLLFTPLKMHVNEVSSGGDFYYSTVTTGPGLLYARSVIRHGVIATVVSEDAAFTHTRWGYRPIDVPAYPAQSSAVRQFALQELKTVLRRDHLRIEKDPSGCPVLLEGDRILPVPVSLAHHDRYVAWSFAYNNNSL